MGIKADLIKELKSLRIRHVDKHGYGTVPLGQAKTEELIAVLESAKKNKQ